PAASPTGTRSEQARMLVTFSPSGFEEVFSDLGVRVAEHTEPPVETVLPPVERRSSGPSCPTAARSSGLRPPTEQPPGISCFFSSSERTLLMRISRHVAVFALTAACVAAIASRRGQEPRSPLRRQDP